MCQLYDPLATWFNGNGRGDHIQVLVTSITCFAHLCGIHVTADCILHYILLCMCSVSLSHVLCCCSLVLVISRMFSCQLQYPSSEHWSFSNDTKSFNTQQNTTHLTCKHKHAMARSNKSQGSNHMTCSSTQQRYSHVQRKNVAHFLSVSGARCSSC